MKDQYGDVNAASGSCATDDLEESRSEVFHKAGWQAPTFNSYGKSEMSRRVPSAMQQLCEVATLRHELSVRMPSGSLQDE
jgi:hypothetical protein